MKNEKEQRLGTFDGVFTPTILTILGVVMYLRLGWVVGNAGFIGALAIIILGNIITICTALSMASMVSNIQIGQGGAYSIISRSLGLEAGGAIGIPLYLSQAFSVAFYIIGFTELWHGYYPSHSVIIVGFVTWLILTILSLISARLAFRAQYFILVAIVFSLISFFMGPSISDGDLLLWGNFPEAEFWETFAIFFPAVTGILAGVNMSGELKTPRRSIIIGTLSAIFFGLVIYISMAYWFAHQATQDQLLADTSVILQLAFYKPFVIAGIMGATLSSALSTLVGAPRTLTALADSRLVPFPRFLGKRGADNEPRNAIFISSLFSLAILLAGSLDQLAQLLTMFFLTTYGTINLVVLIEHSIGIASFRPRLQVSLLIPLVGFTGSMFTMLLINKLFTLITLSVIALIYIILARRELISPWGDVRGGIFTAITEWAAQKALSSTYHPRLWKPSILFPAETPDDLRKTVRLLNSMLHPSGRFYLLSLINTKQEVDTVAQSFESVLEPLRENNVFIRKTLIKSDSGSFQSHLHIVLQTLLNSFLPPNAILFTISNEEKKRIRLQSIYSSIKHCNIGLMYLYICPKIGFGQERTINLWLRDKSPNINLAVLTSLQLSRNWNTNLSIIRTIDNESERRKTIYELKELVEYARLPVQTNIKVFIGGFLKIVRQEKADITIIGMPKEFSQMLTLTNEIQGTVLFVRDSGLESATV